MLDFELGQIGFIWALLLSKSCADYITFPHWFFISKAVLNFLFYYVKFVTWLFLTEPHHEKTCLMSYANNKDADQTAHLHSLIGPFVVRYLGRIIYKLAKSKLSRL